VSNYELTDLADGGGIGGCQGRPRR